MKRNPSAAFTLLEMMTVIAVIVILTGMVLSIAGYAQKKGAQARASGEITMLSSACESYKSDNGNYPRDIPASGSGSTDKLSPKQNFSPVAAVYTDASLFLYKELSGDKDADGKPDTGEQKYLKEMDPRILSAKRDSNKVITAVNYFQDPFGFAYGYSTAAAATEEAFQTEVKSGADKPKRKTGNVLPGFNPGSFDLWSTSGSNTTKTPSQGKAMDLEWAKWIKNW